jgi:peroxiredoxin family protein
VATIEQLREASIESGARFIACQMTMDVFGFTKDDFIDECEFGGAATFLEFAAESDLTLFI